MMMMMNLLDVHAEVQARSIGIGIGRGGNMKYCGECACV